MGYRDTLQSTGKDDAVQVNQRALIDKVLARYSGEFSVFRELLQNSDDAQSSEVEIRFATTEYLHRAEHSKKGDVDVLPLPDLKCTHVTQWTFRNNGNKFTEKDWSRLRRIADGNPDEEKIGAFGVGFYSLFSVTESPLVSSGGYGMEFYWKGDNKDQLSVRHGSLQSNGTEDPWTTIYFDEHRIGHIKKSLGDPAAIAFPIPLKLSGESKLMNVTAVQSRTITIGAKIMHAVYGTVKNLMPKDLKPHKPQPDAAVPSSPPKDPTELHETNVTLTAFTAEVDVQVNDKLASEFIRSTKKKPRRKLEYHLIYTQKEDYERSHAEDNDQPAACGNIFQGLRADLNEARHTRVYIGHATGQTTGIGGHMASHFIPTVERESIDFVDKYLAVWNKELLYVGGLLARVAYESQLSAIHDKWTGATNGTPPRGPLQEDILHALKFFEFHPSTPSPSVGELLAASFYGCSSVSPRMLSSVGVREASTIKEYDPDLAKFLKNMPMLPQRVIRECPRTIQMLRDGKIISPVRLPDILDYLRHHHLNKEELVSCLRWWMSRAGQDKSNADARQLLDAVVFRDGKGRICQLLTVRDFADPQILGNFIPPDSPLPSSLLPHDVAKDFLPKALAGFGWQEFTVIDWLRYISREEIMYKDPAHDFTRSPDWTGRVLTALAFLWPSVSDEAHNMVKDLFSTRKCIPTSDGLRLPKESYLSGTNTGLFCNIQLPTVQFPDSLKPSEETETVLIFIGVRKHADPQLILKRMADKNTWDVNGLVRYLCQMQKSLALTLEDVTKLASSVIFMKESGDPARRYCARELYAPVDDTFQRLGLRVIHLDEKSEWSDESEEAKLLFKLGLRRYPPLDEIVDLCTSKNIAAVRTIAFQYLCKNFASKYSDCDARKAKDIAFIPAENDNGSRLEKPGEVFLDRKWKALGFSVVQDSYVDVPISKLGILEHPPPSKLLSHLTKERPPDEVVARKWFEILYDHISVFSPEERTKLGKTPVVPINRSGFRDWLSPEQCFPGEGARDSFHSKLFAFVNFGSTANQFLNACGARNDPTVTDVARSLVNDPEGFHKAADKHDNFLTQLRNLAVNKRLIDNMILRKMLTAPVLLGNKAMTGFQASDRCTQERRRPNEIFIADDMNAYRMFREAIFVAPQDELLEDFYASLGCKRLSQVVQEQCKVVGNISDHGFPTRCSEIRMLVLERLAIFLHEFTHAKPKISLDWLSRVGNFRVKACEKLSIHKTLEIEGEKNEQFQEASAGAKRDHQGRIELWVSRKHPDMDEVSTSLCRLLFGTVKLSESLLFSMILSSTREALERKGCRVELILNRYHFDRDDPDEMKSHVKEQVPGPTNSPELHHPNRGSQVDITKSEAPSIFAGQNLPQLAEPSDVTTVEASTPPTGPKLPQPVPSPIGHSMPPEVPTTSSATGKRKRVVRGAETSHRTVTQTAQLTRNPKNKSHTKLGLRMLFGGQVARTEQHVIPRREIQMTIGKAIEACQLGADKLRREFDTEAKKKCSDDHYCDTSGKTTELKFLDELRVGMFQSSPGSSGTVQVFATEDHDTLMLTKKDTLDRFAQIIVPIAEAFGLSTESLKIFYDTKGSSIAFNRGGHLYLNLRYFETWHDQDIAKGAITAVQQAQTSWFFTLAHEIAHNMIKSHSSDHAFWFSNICGEYISKLQGILANDRLN